MDYKRLYSFYESLLPKSSPYALSLCHLPLPSPYALDDISTNQFQIVYNGNIFYVCDNKLFNNKIDVCKY